MDQKRFVITLAVACAAMGLDPGRAAGQRGQPLRPARGVYKDRITPNWFADNTCFWYRNDLSGGRKEFIVVHAEQGTRGPAFDHARLAAALSKVPGATAEVQADHLPFDAIEFVGRDKAVRFPFSGAVWELDLASYQAAPVPGVAWSSPGPQRPEPGQRFEEITPETEADGTNLAYDPPLYEDSNSPDGRWTAFIKDHNVFIRDREGREVQLSGTGVAGHSYGMLSWSPDSKVVVASRIQPGEPQPVHLIESSPREGGRARLRTRLYPLPGDKYTTYELWVFDVSQRRGTQVEADRIDFYGPPRLRWRQDSRRFLFHKTDRGHQRFRIIEVDSHTGKARTVYDEQSKTFINTTYESFIHYTAGHEEVLFASERDGWKHLYLIDVERGGIRNPITRGEWVVRGVDRVDEASRQVWFRASGRIPGQDPYLIHCYRVNFDGTGLVALTEGDGTHTVRYSPDRRFLIDTYSRVDRAPVHELRRTSDGRLVCELEKADITELEAGGWQAPEVFVAKARDGKTDIWGILCRPPGLDPNKKIPVIESIYAGPHDSYVPKAFRSTRPFSNLTDLGFIVVQMDGMGTANRSKAFHDVCWQNLGDAGLPDRILWHQAAARRYPYYDLGRVGIYGGSAGGQNAAGAVLFHPEFYKAAVAACGCHDNRMDKASWNEQWMGYPVGPHYAASSNIENAGRLQGGLMLIVGELDTNVPPESTLRFADALIRADKDFDLVLVPGAGHGMGGRYGQRRMQDFFVRHLQPTAGSQ
ncbi:MAG: prolyl oligopeptidase family serine peptidase [Phycisphaerae bacterium]|nr:prolyl oligopeptidase family serine peptidase [Phycisphaerae bacterium]